VDRILDAIDRLQFDDTVEPPRPAAI
jgi:hypothetical protein